MQNSTKDIVQILIAEPIIENYRQQQSQPDTHKELEEYKKKYFAQQRQLKGKNLFQRLFFTWISPLLSYGSKAPLDTDDLPRLHQSMQPQNQYNSMYRNLREVKRSQRTGFTLMKAVGLSYRKPLILLGCLALLITYLTMTAPVLTHHIIGYVKQDPTDRSMSEGIWFLIGIAAVTLGRSISQSHLYFQFAVLGFNLSNTLSLLIYEKSLKYPLICEKKYSISEIINYSQIDAQRMTSMGSQLTAILFTPIQMLIGIWMMYSYIGISFGSGMLTMFVMIIITFYLTKKIIKINQQTLRAKDGRMKVTEEILDIIRFIKVNSIQKYFFNRLDEKRNIQLKSNRKRGLLQVIIVFLFFLSCPLIISLTFITFIELNYEITANIAFSTIIIFNMLQSPLRQFPSALSNIIQMFTSLKRIQKFLLDSQIEFNHIKEIQDPQNQEAIRIDNGTFRWGTEDQSKNVKKQLSEQVKEYRRNNLIINDWEEEDGGGAEEKKQNINSPENTNDKMGSNSCISDLSTQQIGELGESFIGNRDNYTSTIKRANTVISRGKLVIILGDIGSGKSSFLMAVLNEMKSSSKAMVTINGTIAYAAQKPWIMASNVRQNIIFTQQFDKRRFDQAVYYASLNTDLKMLVKGAFTEIGQKGVNLSGGQKARIGLARAIYSNRDIIFLDDVISAVDIHVGEFIMQETIMRHLKGKTIVMPTHAVKYAEYADQIIVLKKGVIVRKGHFRDIYETSQFQEVFLSSLERQKEEKINKQDQKISKDQRKMMDSIKKIQKDKKQMQKMKQSIKLSFAEKAVEDLIIPQDHKKGSIDIQVLKQYIRINGGVWFFLLVFFSMSMWLALSIISNIQLEKWCESTPKDNMHLYIYLILSIGSSLFALVRAYTLVLSGFKQGQIVHKKIIQSLLYASLNQFYNRVPVGRIMNRLSKDLRQLDETIGYAMGNYLTNLFNLFGTLTICVYASTPYVVIPIVIVAFLCNKLRGYYMQTQREIIRIQAKTNSPIVSGFISTINGLATIRAYKVQNQFLEMQIKKISTNKQARITREALESWFALRLTLLSFCINMFSIGFCLLGSNQNPSLAGLLLAYAFNLSDDIISLTFSWANLQTRMISVERIFDFMKIEPEKAYQKYCQKWSPVQQGSKPIIQQGRIQFKFVGLKYREDLPYALKGLSFSIQPGQKVGIVGRTGAGKSTIFSTLLRIVEPTQGQILVDEIDYSSYHIKDLRSAITMIDQEPTLINSSFRENLGMTHRYTDDQLYEVLKECNLYDTVMEKDGLEGSVDNNSLSAGQKQLLCICRAFLKKSKIVLIDEATANIDLKNDELIQKVIETKFAGSTVLTIAHRLTTLKNSDLILVMDKGRVAEFGPPGELEKLEGGVYSQMVRKNMSEFLI